jgi:hypothetical protein
MLFQMFQERSTYGLKDLSRRYAAGANGVVFLLHNVTDCFQCSQFKIKKNIRHDFLIQC